MNVLIACYSRSGNTRKVAAALAEALRSRGAEVTVEEIVDLKRRTGFMGSLGAGKDAMFKSPTRIAPTKADLADFDLVIVGTPVWAWTAAPAAIAYCQKAAGRVKKTAFFCTMGASGARGTFAAMNQAMREEPLATLALTERQLRDQAVLEAKVSELAGRL
jgi:flavodoxin